MDKNEKGLLVSIAVIVISIVLLIFSCGMLASGQLVMAIDEIADSQGQMLNSLVVFLAALSWMSLPWVGGFILWKKINKK